MSPSRDIASEDASPIFKDHEGVVHFKSFVSSIAMEDSPISLEKEIASINTKYQARSFHDSETRAISIELIESELDEGIDFAVDVISNQMEHIQFSFINQVVKALTVILQVRK